MKRPTAAQRKVTNGSRQDFMDGFAMAVADLVRQSGHPTLAAGLIAGHGFQLSDFDNCAPYDRQVIAELFRTESQLRLQEKARKVCTELAAEIIVKGRTALKEGAE